MTAQQDKTEAELWAEQHPGIPAPPSLDGWAPQPAPPPFDCLLELASSANWPDDLAEVERVSAIARRNGYQLIALAAHPGEYLTVYFGDIGNCWAEHESLAASAEYIAEHDGNDADDAEESEPA